jgi:hypothetical protein
MGADAKATTYGFEWDMSDFGVKGLTLNYAILNIEANNGKEADEDDYILSYDIQDNLNLTAIYSDVDDKINGEKFKNTRVFVNYMF